MTGNDIVESVVVDVGEGLSARGLGPDPILEGALDACELVLRGLGFPGVQLPPLMPVLDPACPRFAGCARSARRRAIRRHGVAPVPQVVRQSALPRKGMHLDRPMGDGRDMVDGGFDADDLLGEGAITSVGSHGAPSRAVISLGFRSTGWAPRRASTLETKRGSAPAASSADGELFADLAGQIGVGRLELPRLGIEEDQPSQLGLELGGGVAEQLGDVVDIDPAGYRGGKRSRRPPR